MANSEKLLVAINDFNDWLTDRMGWSRCMAILVYESFFFFLFLLPYFGGLVAGTGCCYFQSFLLCFLSATNWIAQRKTSGTKESKGCRLTKSLGMWKVWGIGPGNMMWRLCRFRCSWGTSAIIASVIRSACQSNRRSSRGAGKQRLSAVAGISGGQEDPSCDSPTFDLQHSCNISSSVSPKGKGATNANSKKKSETHATKWGESFSRGAVVAFSEGRCRSLGVFSVFHSQLFPVTKYRLPTTNCQLPASRQRKSQKRY